MNKYVRALIYVPCGMAKVCLNKVFHRNNFRGKLLCAMSPLTEISLDVGGKLAFGKKFRMRDGAKIRVRKGAECIIGDNVSINTNNIIACRERVSIGNGVMFSPNVQIYDHDHDFRAKGGIWEKKYKTAPVEIGDNCWIGTNTVILRGTSLGSSCVVGAGCILKGSYPSGSVIIQKRDEQVRY